MFENAVRERPFLIAGIDEAGRGALAGPVVAACAVAPADFICSGLTDSKLLSHKQREKLFEYLVLHLQCFSYCFSSAQDIDRINIRQATLEAMRRSYAQVAQDAIRDIIIDGVDAPITDSRAVIKADQLFPIVSAASIIAKVIRDRTMLHYHQLYPLYEFDKHKGYPTARHRALLEQYGPSPIHRLSYHVKKSATD